MLKPNIMANTLSAVLIYISEHVFNLNIVLIIDGGLLFAYVKKHAKYYITLAANSKTFFIIFF